MKNFIVRFLVYLSVLKCFFVLLPTVSAQKLEGESLEKFVWSIFESRNELQGTAFAIGPNLFVTNYHVILHLSERDLSQNFLISNNREEKLSFHKLIRLDLSSDLALFQTKEETEDYLDISNISEQIGDKVFTIGYPRGKFRKSESVGSVIYEDQWMYFLAFNHSNFSGASGSPIFNEQEKITGVISLGIYNIVYIIKPPFLKDFIKGKLGSPCISYQSIQSCFNRELDRLKWKEGKNSMEKFYLYFLHGSKEDLGKRGHGRLIDQMEQELYPPLLTLLAWSYYHGENGVEPNLNKAILLLERAIDQDYAPAQHLLGLWYYDGTKLDQDLGKAIFLFQRASALAYPLADQILNIVLGSVKNYFKTTKN